MQSSSPQNQNTSFIPKRGTVRRRKATPKRQVFVFSVVTYSFLFAALIAAGGVFFYSNYLQSQLEEEAIKLNQAAASFSTQQLLQVQDFSLAIDRAAQRIAQNVAMSEVLDTLDEAVGAPIEIETLDIKRTADLITLEAQIVTDSFDGALFQRESFLGVADVFSLVEFSEVSFEQAESSEEGQSGIDQKVTADVTLDIPVAYVQYQPFVAPLAQPLIPDVPAASTPLINQANTVTPTSTSSVISDTL